jgi:hypothetical protein
MIGNVLIIVAVVVLADVAPWLASGIANKLLGFAAFGFIMTMVAFTDVAISRRFRSEWAIEDAWAMEIQTKYEVLCELFANDQGKPTRLPVPAFPLTGGRRIFAFIILGIVAAVSLQSAWVRSVPQLKQIQKSIEPAAAPDAGASAVSQGGLFAADRLPIGIVRVYRDSARPLTPQNHEKISRVFYETRRELVA